ncbi:MAG TPA: two-component regulator propeller domain-containing protein, partial [Flavitalea sp.]|nr:two-component regulator propeller domain-containing protein [Flavitalea sp.]
MVMYGKNIFLILFFHCSLTYSQPELDNLKTYTTNNGLSLSEINSVDSDLSGFVWVATNNGLNRFDGREFTRFYTSQAHKNGLSGNRIKQIICDSLVVWVAVENRGIACYFDQADYFIPYRHDSSENNSLVDDNVECLHLSKNKKLFIGTTRGLSIFSRSDNTFLNYETNFESHKPLHITSFAEGNDGTIWIGTNHQGLFCYEPRMGLYAIKELPRAILSESITSIVYFDYKSELWLGTTKGLWISKVSGNKIGKFGQPHTAFNDLSIECIRQDDLRSVWVGTKTRGLFYLNNTNVVKNYVHRSDGITKGLANTNIKDIHIDRNGSVWFATPSGLQWWHKSMQRFSSFRTDMNGSGDVSTSITRLASWNKYIIAANDRGITISDTDGVTMTKFLVGQRWNKSATFNRSTTIDNNFYLFGADGIFQLIIQDHRIRLEAPNLFRKLGNFVTQPVEDLVQLSDSIFWLSTGKLVFAVNVNSGKADTIVSSSVSVQSDINIRLFKDGNNRILLSDNRGVRLYRFPGPTEIYKQFVTDKFEINDIWCDEKNVWIATSDLGLFMCDTSLNVLSNYTT